MDNVDSGSDQGLAAFANVMHGLQPEVADNPDATLLALTQA